MTQRPATRDVILAVAAEYGMTPGQIKFRTRRRKVAWPRQILMLMLRQNCGRSYQQIARAVGVSDHTTVIYGVRRARERVLSDPDERENVMRIMQALRIVEPMRGSLK